MEYCVIGLEAYLCTCLVGSTDNFHLLIIMTAVFKTLEVYLLAVIYSKLKPLGKCIYNRRTNAVQTARNLISAAAEFTACVQYRIYDCSGTYLLLGVNTRRNTTSVIRNLYNVTGEYLYVNFCTIACECLVNSIIDYLVYKVVQTALTSRTDIHTGSFSYCLKTLKYLDIICSVSVLNLCVVLYILYFSVDFRLADFAVFFKNFFCHALSFHHFRNFSRYYI